MFTNSIEPVTLKRYDTYKYRVEITCAQCLLGKIRHYNNGIKIDIPYQLLYMNQINNKSILELIEYAI